MRPMGVGRHLRARLSDAAVLVTVVGAAATLALLTSAHPSESDATNFLFLDHGLNLLVADVLRSGGVLYRDVFYPYGPLSAYSYALFAAIFGNTPKVYYSFLTVVSCVNVALVYVLIRRAAGIITAALVTVVAMLTVLVVPGSLVGGYTVSAYLPLERMTLVALALCWEPPLDRSAGRSLLLGVVLGVWQGVKFGGAVAGFGSLVVLDGLYLMFSGERRESWGRWTRSLMAIATGFIAVEMVWAAWAFTALPVGLARDTLWPAYMVNAAYAWVTPETRWLGWSGWRLFVAQFLVPFSSAVLGVIGLYHWLMSARRSVGVPTPTPMGFPSGAVFIPLCFYAIASLFYFRHVHHFRQFMWALVPASAWEIERRGLTTKLAMLALWTPAFLTVLKASILPAALGPGTVLVQLPTGGTLAASGHTAAQVDFLRRFVASDTHGLPVLFIPGAAGWHYFFRVPRATRHTWFMAPEIIRPYEEETFLGALDATVALISCGADDQPPDSEFPPLPFPESIAQPLRTRLQPWMAEAGCRAYRIRR